jgi:PII-like signaling protein
MQTFPKKQLNVICERPILPRLRKILDQDKVSGYTILPALSGRGTQGSWDNEGMLGDAGQMVHVICILDEALCNSVLEHVFELIGHQIGVITVQDVSVVRPAHF